MATSNAHLLSFEGISASVGGMDISSIIEMHLVATANSIPSVTLMVDAGHPGAGGHMYVDTVSLSAARQLISACQAMVKTSATLSLSITCRDISGGATQSLNLNGWVLAGVAPSPMQRGGVCGVGLTFMHPLCRAHFGGAVPGLIGQAVLFDNVEGGNPLSVFVSALGEYASAYRDSPLPASIDGGADPESVRSALISQMEKAAGALSSSLAWSGGGLPCESELGGWEDYIVRGLASYAHPAGGSSVFQIFTGCVVPECSLSIGGDYTSSTLEVKPFTPWESASLSISDSDIISMLFPQSDPSPISGVKVEMLATDSETFTTYQPIACQNENAGKPAEAFYVPESELAAENMYGPIYHYKEPGWMVNMAYYAKTAGSAAISDVKVATKGDFKTAASTPRSAGTSFSGGGGKAADIEYVSAIMACAKAFFETSFTKDWTFSVTTRLLFSSGGILCPGRVVSITSAGGEVIGGYINTVEHSISVQNRTATTRVTCTHPRFNGLPKQISGSGNAMYS